MPNRGRCPGWAGAVDMRSDHAVGDGEAPGGRGADLPTGRGLPAEVPAEIGRSPVGLVMSPELLAEVVAHMRAALPDEGVGLLAVAPPGPDPFVRATAYVPGTNVDASPTRYTMHPREVIDALSEFARRGWRLGAIVHSHPSTPPVPSPTDRREAYHPMALAMIVSFAMGDAEIGVWRMDDPMGPVPARLVTKDDGAGRRPDGASAGTVTA